MKKDPFHARMLDNVTVGVDIEDVHRFEKLHPKTDKAFLGRIFTKQELKDCFSRKNAAEALAARFSAKESVSKALNALDLPPIAFSDIEITNDKRGVPKVALAPRALRPYEVKLSMSHAKHLVLTAAVATKKYVGR